MDKEHYGYDQPSDLSYAGIQLNASAPYPDSNPPTSQVDKGQMDKEHSGYDQPPSYDDSQVIRTQDPQWQTMSQNVVIQSAPERPPSYMWLSCLVYWFCSCICGGIAMAFSHSADTAADEGRYEEARSNGRASLTPSIIGIVFGIASYTFLIIHWQNSKSSSKSSYDGY